MKLIFKLILFTLCFSSCALLKKHDVGDVIVKNGKRFQIVGYYCNWYGCIYDYMPVDREEDRI